MSRIEYRLFRRRDVEAAQAQASSATDTKPTAAIPRSGEQPRNAAQNAIPCNQDVALDDVCGIVAYDGNDPVARIALTYTQLLVDGQLQKCIVGSGFFVHVDYRSQAVGLTILLKVLGLGLPYIEASVSGQMQKILERFPKFSRVDDSPLYQVPVDRDGIVQMAKWDLYNREHRVNGFLSDKILKARILASFWLQRRRIGRHDHSGLEVMGMDAAMAYCLEQFGRPLYRVQLPWTVAGLKRALSGENPNHAAWLVKCDNAGPWLVSLYRRERALGRNAAGQPRLLLEAHLNEIYPPPDTPSSVRSLLAFTMQRAREMSVSVLHIHATAPSIHAACEQSGLQSRSRKSIFVAPAGIDDVRQTAMKAPENWLCRAVSEDEFEESFGADTSPETASCVPAAD